MYNIKFRQLSDEIIPTKLSLMVDDVIVNYQRCNDCFGYNFTIYSTLESRASDIIKYLARVMENQSEDHASVWRTTSIKPIDRDEWSITYRVKFRIRNSY